MLNFWALGSWVGVVVEDVRVEEEGKKADSTSSHVATLGLIKSSLDFHRDLVRIGRRVV